MRYTKAKVKHKLGYKLIGTKYLKDMVCQTILIFPNEIIEYVTKHCWFIGSFEDGWGLTLRGEELKRDECLIFLSDELLNQDTNQIKYTIAHEIGHAALKHKNSILEIQTKTEVRKQEKEADEFARRWLGH